MASTARLKTINVNLSFKSLINVYVYNIMYGL